MDLNTAHDIAGTLGKPSKMPGYSYGIPAGKAAWVPAYAISIDDSDPPKLYGCPTGGKLHDVQGTTCRACYALRGNYLFSNVKTSQYKRLKNIATFPWIKAMVTLLRHYVKASQPYFRWHDSGDLLSVRHLQCIAYIARLTPNVKHWLPTREGAIVKEYLQRGYKVPDNLLIRISAIKIDSYIDTWYYWTSTVHKNTVPEGHVCPAPMQKNTCGACRACWSKEVKNVSYHVH